LYFITLYARTPFLYFTHSLGVITPWICTSRSMYILYCWSCIWRGSHALRGARVPLLDRPFLVLSILLLSFIHVVPFDSILDFYSILLFLCYHCVRYLYHIAVMLIFIVII